jgi:hypothetical protein
MTWLSGAAHFVALNAKGNFPHAPHCKPQDAVTDDVGALR